MGNIFDDLNPVLHQEEEDGKKHNSRAKHHSHHSQHHNHQHHHHNFNNPNRNAGANHHNSNDEEDEKIDISFYLNDKERLHLTAFFQKHYSHVERKYLPSSVPSSLKTGNTFTANKVLHYLNIVPVNSLEKLENFIVECARIGSTRSFEMLWAVSTTDLEQHGEEEDPSKSHLVDRKILHFVKFLYSLAVYGIGESSVVGLASQLQEYYLTMLRTVSPQYQNNFRLEEFIGIVNSYSPYGFCAFQTYILDIFLVKSSEEESSFKLFQPVSLLNESDVMSPTLITLLSLHNVDLQGNWKRLYSSNHDGRSFNRIVYHLLGYEGPTCIIIRCSDEENSILGAYSAERWKDNNRFYGSSKNFLFTSHPKVRLFRSRVATNGAYQWLNTKSYGMPHGFGFGGSTEAFRLFIPESFEICTGRNSCMTYEPGHLVKDERFEIDCLEVWACGGKEKIQQGLAAQKQSRELTQKSIEKARKVDRAVFFDNAFDREFLLSNTFSHQKQTERPDV